jgi:hypothetical protein
MSRQSGTEPAGADDAVVRLGDLFAMLYYHMACEMVESFGLEGERALRTAIRKFGAERGVRLRLHHETRGLPINLESLFTHYDLPDDPRFRRNLRVLSPEVRLSETHRCPYFEVWRERDGLDVARIYCEEVHHAIFGSYHPAVQTNLTRTLTRGDSFCDFAVFLREANRDVALNPVVEGIADTMPWPEEDYVPAAAMGNLFVTLYWYLAHETLARFGAEGEACVRRAVRNFGRDRGKRLRARHEREGREINLVTLFTYGDLPRDPRFRRELHSLTPHERISDTLRCPYFEVWERHGDVYVGRLYCEEVHHAMWMSYDPRIEVNLEKTLTKGNERCEFRVYMRK